MAAALKNVILIILGTMGNPNIYHDLGIAKEGDKIAAGLLVKTKIGQLSNNSIRNTCVQGTGSLAYLEGDDGTHKFICDPPNSRGGNKRHKKSKKTKKRKTMKKKKLTKKRKTMKKKK